MFREAAGGAAWWPQTDGRPPAIDSRPYRCRIKKAGADAPAFFVFYGTARLLDLGFPELDMLARNRIVLLEYELVGHRAGVLLRNVKDACISGADELDLDHGGLCHRITSYDAKAPRVNLKAATYASRASSQGFSLAIADFRCRGREIRSLTATMQT